MTTRNRIARAALALAVAGSIAVAVGRAPFTPAGASPKYASVATSTVYDYVRTSTSNINLSNQGRVNTTIVSVAVPAGSWVFSIAGDAVNFGQNDFTRCGIMAGGSWLGGVTTMVGSGSGATQAGGFAKIAKFASATSFTASLRCSHDTTGIVPYIDAGAVLWAHRSPAVG